MKKVLVIAVLALLLMSVSGFAETGIGVTAHYPFYVVGLLGDEPSVDFLMIGASLRSKQSIFLLDVTGLYPLKGGLICGIVDIGVCFDVFFFRLAVAGGLDGFYSLNSEDFFWGPNIKTNVDFKLGPATVGLSGVIPLTMLISDDEFRVGNLREVFTGISLNVIYWF